MKLQKIVTTNKLNTLSQTKKRSTDPDLIEFPVLRVSEHCEEDQNIGDEEVINPR